LGRHAWKSRFRQIGAVSGRHSIFPLFDEEAVAPAYRFDWSQDDVDGRSTQLLYLDWLTSGDDGTTQCYGQHNRQGASGMLIVD